MSKSCKFTENNLRFLVRNVYQTLTLVLQSHTREPHPISQWQQLDASFSQNHKT